MEQKNQGWNTWICKGDKIDKELIIQNKIEKTWLDKQKIGGKEN